MKEMLREHRLKVKIGSKECLHCFDLKQKLNCYGTKSKTFIHECTFEILLQLLAWEANYALHATIAMKKRWKSSKRNFSRFCLLLFSRCVMNGNGKRGEIRTSLMHLRAWAMEFHSLTLHSCVKGDHSEVMLHLNNFFKEKY